MSAADHPPHEHHEGSCRRYLDSLSDYVDGELSDELCRELEEHMAMCDNCRVVVNTLSKTITLYRRMPSPELPDEVKERLFKVLHLDPHAAEQGDAPAGKGESPETPTGGQAV